MPAMRVLSHITLKSKIHLLNYSGIWYTARHPHITEKYWELWSPALHPPCKNPAGAHFCCCINLNYAAIFSRILSRSYSCEVDVT